MAEFINTVDVLGDDALTDSIIDRSITEYCDDSIQKIAGYAFRSCSKLTTANFPVATSVGSSAFDGCSKLTTANFPVATSVGSDAFRSCSALTTLILRNTTKAATLSAATTFANTPIASGTCYIYVPSALIDTYKSATNWSTYAAQFRALEDYPEICGGEM